jgi:2'-5' RNA ligase
MHSIYDDMWQKASALIRDGQAEPDPLIGDPDDSRRGLTLIIRPSGEVLDRFCSFLADASRLEEAQHFYAKPEIHTTVMSIITCVPGFDIDDVCLPDYVRVIEETLSDIPAFGINYSGLTASSNCVMARGFPSGAELDQIRNALRDNFSSSGIESSIDQRYPISTAHSTLIRFRTGLNDAGRFMSFLERARFDEFGESKVSEVHLVLNDWYHRMSAVTDLHSFPLRPASTGKLRDEASS